MVQDNVVVRKQDGDTGQAEAHLYASLTILLLPAIVILDNAYFCRNCMNTGYSCNYHSDLYVHQDQQYDTSLLLPLP